MHGHTGDADGRLPQVIALLARARRHPEATAGAEAIPGLQRPRPCAINFDGRSGPTATAASGAEPEEHRVGVRQLSEGPDCDRTLRHPQQLAATQGAAAFEEGRDLLLAVLIARGRLKIELKLGEEALRPLAAALPGGRAHPEWAERASIQLHAWIHGPRTHQCAKHRPSILGHVLFVRGDPDHAFGKLRLLRLLLRFVLALLVVRRRPVHPDQALDIDLHQGRLLRAVAQRHLRRSVRQEARRQAGKMHGERPSLPLPGERQAAILPEAT
mmetsp:Transcript_126398/g.365914  ORF Transcript_126398/g.365914 Transcript_126398/m.365914 type:complete len:271 (-) Transcript_126398:585-1397(-)